MTLTQGARITGAALAALLALIAGAWILRDLLTAQDPADLWGFWAGDLRGRGVTPLTTTIADPVLLLVYAAVAVCAPRSPVAASALVAAGVVTLGIRLPSLWVLTAPYMDLQATDALRTRALYSAFAALGLGVGLLITAVAGRRAAGDHGDDRGPRLSTGVPQPRTPTRPAQSVAVLAFLLLGTAGAVTVAWQVRWAYTAGADAYLDRFTGGEQAPVLLLQPPSAWLAAVVAVLALVAAVGGLFQAVHTRTLGAVAAVLIAADGAVGLGFALRQKLFDRFVDLGLESQLLVATWLFESAAGAVLLVALLRRGEEEPCAPPAYGCPPPPPPPPPPPGGYGYPRPGSGPPAAGGPYTPPRPPSSPPPGW
ncbi:hypothetical protein J7E88_07490 [Streptomyces sp. ISL-10]|uniref:hypothetical protein n=1 Tax=Streptomyces sp. ISL-10 TaxID=2819172 RepID=UPI001BE7301B|nr:hypothetical protein [Streptomyces sp. ISL-10]MBT2365164.1 hypothetical protein [Streptomyces sp. ISL-10]